MLDHSTLPSVSDARLPATYEAAKTALAECANLDECQSWADKAEALASYAKQSQDDTLRKMADRIQARAISRAGELLKQIAPATKHNAKKTEGGQPPVVSRTQAATDAGLSEHQRKQAIRVASVPRDEFESLVESDNPPTVSALAEMGKRTIVDLKGRDPKHFNQALHFVGMFKLYARELEKHDISTILPILEQSERDAIRQYIAKIDSIHDQIVTRI